MSMSRENIRETINSKYLESRKIDSRFLPFIEEYLYRVASVEKLTDDQLEEYIEKYFSNLQFARKLNIEEGTAQFSQKSKTFIFNFSENSDIRKIANEFCVEQEKIYLDETDLQGLDRLKLCEKYYDEYSDDFKDLLTIAKLGDIYGIEPEVSKSLGIVFKSESENNENMRIQGIQQLYLARISSILYSLKQNPKDKDATEAYNKLKTSYNDIMNRTSISAEEIAKLEEEMISNEHYGAGITQVELSIESIAPFEKSSKSEYVAHDFKTDYNNIKYEVAINEKNSTDNPTSKEIDKGVSWILDSNNYTDKYAIFISEYMKRGAILFGWTREEFEKKVNNVKQNISEINEIKIDSAKVGEAKFNSIDISNEMQSPESALKIIMHEINHSAVRTIIDDKTYEGEIIFNENTVETVDSYEASAVNEWINECAAGFLSSKKSIYGKYNELIDNSGYANISEAGSMLAAALGMSELELVKARDKGKTSFLEEVKNKNKGIDTYSFLRDSSLNMGKALKREGPALKKERTEYIARLYKSCEEVIDLKKEKEPLEEKNIYNEYKLKSNMLAATKKRHLSKKKLKEDGIDVKELKKEIKTIENTYGGILEAYGKKVLPEFSFDNSEILIHGKKYFKRKTFLDMFKKEDTPVKMLEEAKNSKEVTKATASWKEEVYPPSEALLNEEKLSIETKEKEETLLQ